MKLLTPSLRGLVLAALGLAASPAAAQGADPQPGELLVAVGAGGLRGVVLVDPADGAQTVVTQGDLLVDPADLVVAADRSILVADAAAQIVRVDPATGAQSVVTSGGLLSTPSGIALGADGTIYVADTSGVRGFGGIVAVDPATGEQELVLEAIAATTPHRIAVEPSGNLLFVRMGLLSSPLFRMNLGFGFVMMLSRDLGRATGLAVSPDGAIYAGDRGVGFAGQPRVLSVDPVTGAPTPVSARGSLGGLTGLDVDGNAYATTATAVVRVLLADGTQEPVSSGGHLADVTAVRVVPPEAECFLVIGMSSGDDVFFRLGHAWTTQVGDLRASFPVTMASNPVFPLPAAPGPFEGVRPAGSAPPPGGLVARFHLQVLMWNPDVFPADPERSSNGLELSVWRDGRVTGTPYGAADGMQLGFLTWTASDGTRWVRFPFTIDGF